MTDSEKTAFAFFSFLNHQEATQLRGGILVIDVRGKPLEFRCTSPVRPTTLQRMLYGRALIPHVTVDLMAVPLVKALRERPQAIFVGDAETLELRKKIDVPVIHLRRQGEMLGSTSAEREKPLVVESPSGWFQAVVATPHWEYTSDVSTVRDPLSAVFANSDVLEPFDRVIKALLEIDQQKGFEG